MGKLHTIKRAVRRNPEAFLYRATPHHFLRAKSARFNPQTQQWEPSNNGWGRRPYHALVVAVLQELGYTLNAR